VLLSDVVSLREDSNGPANRDRTRGLWRTCEVDCMDAMGLSRKPRLALCAAATVMMMCAPLAAEGVLSGLFQAAAAGASHLLFHEACHAAAVSNTGGTVAEVGFLSGGHLGYIGYEAGGNETATAIAPYCCNIPLSQALRDGARENEDSVYLKTWAMLALVDLPMHLGLSYVQDENDLNLFEDRSGIDKEWMIGAAIINSICYATDYDNVHVEFDEESIALGYRLEF